MRRSEAAFVDAVVDGVVNPLVELVDLLAQVLWVKITARLRLQVVQETDDLARLIGDDGVEVLVPNDWHCEARVVILVRFEVEIA